MREKWLLILDQNRLDGVDRSTSRHMPARAGLHRATAATVVACHGPSLHQYRPAIAERYRLDVASNRRSKQTASATITVYIRNAWSHSNKRPPECATPLCTGSFPVPRVVVLGLGFRGHAVIALGLRSFRPHADFLLYVGMPLGVRRVSLFDLFGFGLGLFLRSRRDGIEREHGKRRQDRKKGFRFHGISPMSRKE